jgi:[ribosomal protein S5]-alanine N-acetyltransferase
MALSLFKKAEAPLVGDKVILRRPLAKDYESWTKLRRESRAFLEPWEPSWTRDELSRAAYNERLSRYARELRDGSGHVFFIFLASTMELTGGITLGHIRRGVAQSGVIGYWMGEPYAGQGLMADAVSVIKAHAFGPLALHRVEAACIPDNERSVRLLKKAGFALEGQLRSYLKINGRWRDHLLFSCLEDDAGAALGEVRKV